MHAAQPTPTLTVNSANIGIAGRVLVDQLSLSVGAGDWLAVLGRNGAGKTQTLRALAGLQVLLSGDMTWSGRDFSTYDAPDRARAVTMVTQHQQDAFDNDVLHHVLLGRYPHHGPWRSPTDDDFRSAQSALTALDLTALAARPITQLSGGERQRVALAQALVQDTPLLLVDEPLSHQDPAGSARVLSCLDAFRVRGGSVVSAMHDVNLARHYANRVLILGGDGTWQLGDAEELITATTVTELYGVPVRDFDVGGRPWFVPELAS